MFFGTPVTVREEFPEEKKKRLDAEKEKRRKRNYKIYLFLKWMVIHGFHCFLLYICYCIAYLE